jgi:hypothetical protein
LSTPEADRPPALGDFVSQVLIEICEGLAQSRERLEVAGAILNPRQFGEAASASELEHRTRRRITNVDFDLLVEAEGSAASKEGVFVGVLSIGLGKTNTEGQVQKTANRVRFSVPLVLPVAPGIVESEREEEQAERDRTSGLLRSHGR